VTTVQLRPIAVEDVDTYIRLYSDPRSNLYDDFDLISQQDAAKIRAQIIAGQKPGTEVEFAILADGAIAGFFTEWLKRGRLYLGYHLLPEFYGRGIATAALRAYIQHCPREHLPLLRLAIDPANAPSIVVARKAGFVPFRRRSVNGNTEIIFRLPADQLP